MKNGFEITINQAALARIHELRRMVQRGIAAQEELSGLTRGLAAEAGVDLDESAQIRIVNDTLLVIPEVDGTLLQPPEGEAPQ